MASKRDIKILTELLDLDDIKVISHRLHPGIGMILQTESKQSYSTCPRCGTKSHKLHQNHRHIVKDLPLGEKPVFLEINRRQFKCEICKKPFSEDLDFVSKKRTYTKRLAQQIIQEVLDSDIHSVASKGIVTTEEIERMLKDASEKLPNLKPLNLKRLGLDEIALIKGHGNYCAVLIDLDTSKLIALLNGRTQEVIKETLIEWGTEVLEQIEEVSIDLWQGYKNLVLELMPNAQVVADRFHVMTQKL
ncbi:ISL3 family transposase [Pelatocladus sp. BLCC-F211]|uniref:ISL3 family transposase n=1 Tax=Pelatocladus sp. BLCC-F211 TaxID=3342752 RepID=UPI0035B7B282